MENLTKYDKLPETMINYLRYNGSHFNKKLCDFALSKMRTKSGRLAPYTKEQVDNILKAQNIELKNNKLYDYVYVANMCKADFLGSSIMDEPHVALYVKDVIDDPDAYTGIVFNRWYADMSYMGEPIDWEDML